MKGILVKFFIIVLLTFAPFASFSQAKIRVNIENHIDSIYYLIKYTSDKSHCVIDTSSLSSGYKIFSNKTDYNEGIYVIADSKQNPLFEILIGRDQKFSIHVEELMDLKSYEVKGCKETESYFKVYSRTFYDRLHIKALESELKYHPENIRKIDSIKNELYKYQESMLRKDDESFLNTYIKFTEDRPICDLPLCDERILNSRLLKNKLDKYFDNSSTTQTPEFICNKIDEFVLSTDECQEIRDYILWYLYSKYFNPEKTENELVYIHLVDEYFSKLEIENLTENIRKEIIRRADVLRKITIGQVAPSFQYIDENGDIVDLDDIRSKFTVLFFYKPDCQKCIRDKRILGLVKKRINNIEILHIDISEENNSTSQDIIDKYDIMTTPTIYLLNEKKEIIAKHIKAERIEFHIIKR